MGYEIGPRMRKYREAQDLSQKEFAELIGVSNSRVSNWEQGINRPDVDILSKICEVLKVSPSELLDIKTEETKINTESELPRLLVEIKLGKNPFAANLIDFLASLSKEEWETIEKLSKVIKKYYETT